jgi:hypothetical protein
MLNFFVFGMWCVLANVPRIVMVLGKETIGWYVSKKDGKMVSRRKFSRHNMTSGFGTLFLA